MFRSLLKLTKVRRSRFPCETHIENILNMCLGSTNLMQESTYATIKEEDRKIQLKY
jgi:hypothetical protein